MIRVLVAEDSAVTREYFVYLLGQDPALQVVGLARDGLEAVVEAERLRPDVILMDIYMPRMDGYEATHQIMARVPTPIVMVSASFRKEEVAMTMEALRAGALMVVEKPSGLDDPRQEETARRLVETVKLMAEVRVVRRWPKSKEQGPSPDPRSPSPSFHHPPRKIRLIAIGASTGGPQVVAEIFRELPQNLAAPVLMVQHMAPGFTPGFAEWLEKVTSLQVKLAEAGVAVRPGAVFLAPEALQMGITADGRIRLTRDPGEDGFRPSATYLFDSAALAYGKSALGILLTGMGRDGASGLRRLRDAGGVTIAQDEESSIVFGMPGAAIQLGAAVYVLPSERIAGAIRGLVTG